MYQNNQNGFFDMIRIRQKGPVYIVSVFPSGVTDSSTYLFGGKTPGQILAAEIGRGFLQELCTGAPYADGFANGAERAAWLMQRVPPRQTTTQEGA